jgi:ribosome biogenesis GTPase
MEKIRGIVTRYQSGFYTLQTEHGEEITAHLRGRLKRGPKTGDLVAVGDWVLVSQQPDGSGMIEEIEERRSKLSRLAPTARGEYEQILIANLDQALFIFACADPEPRLRMLDRFLIIAEQQHIPAVIVANKIDLVGGQKGAKNIFGHYADLGYKLIYTSAESGKGLKELKALLAGKVSIFTGPSGVGKSSLLNEIQPDLGLRVSEVSETTGKGKHTTTVREMFPLEGGGFVADTPGLKSLGLWDIEPEELDGYFPEIAPLVWQCEYSDCTHIDQPGCAVFAAVQNGTVHPERYESYVRLVTSGE